MNQRPIDPYRHSGLDTQKDSPGCPIREIDLAKSVQAAPPQEFRVVVRIEQPAISIEKFGGCGIDIDASVPLDVQHALDVEHIEHFVVAEGDRARTLSEAHGVIQKLELKAFVAAVTQR